MLTWRERLAGLPRDARDTLFLLAVVAWIMLPQLERLPAWAMLVAAAFLGWRGYLAVGARPLPRRLWIVAGLAGAVIGTLLTYRTLLGRDAGVTMIFMLLALKTLELRARRDVFVIFFLGFFTMLTSFFFSQSLLTAVAMLVGLLGLLTALVNAHMPVGKPPLLEAARTAGWMTLLGAPIMVVLFVLFPRLGPLWGLPSDALTGRSGLSSTMRVGNMASLALDDSIALRVKFEGTPPPQREMYFRGPVLSAFDGREWKPMLQPLRARTGLLGLGPQLEVSGQPVRYEVTLEPNNRPWVLLLDAPGEAPRIPGMELFMSNELVWVSTKPISELLRYRATSYTKFRYGPRNIGGVPFEYTELPADSDPRTRALAAQMRANPALAAGGPIALVNAALTRLRTGGYSYTLDPGTYGQNTADEFWFDRKEGFCEHIASSFVILMRAMEIPARIVTGYQGGELNAIDGYWVVRHSDAHAWAEVWLAGQGWVRVDPTSSVAPGRIGSLQRPPRPTNPVTAVFGTVSPDLVASVRAMWDAMNNSWNQRVLNYTQSRQLDMLKDLGFQSPSWEDLSYVLIAVIVIVALGGAAWTLWDRREHDPWLRLLQRARRRLVQAGIDLSPAAAPRQMAMVVSERFGPQAAPLADWLLKLESQRYARSPAASLRRLQREFRNLAWPV